ncbi:MAG TPA: hypothetical protein VHO67_12840 [Polyangia bacterium]|nr:hypothetical protein [Polyangia bacterium]
MASHTTHAKTLPDLKVDGQGAGTPYLDGVTAGGRTASRTIDVAVLRHRPLPVVPWVLAGVLDLAAAAVIVLRPVHAGALIAGGLHLAAVIPILLWRSLTSSERWLGGAFTFAIPVAGAALSAIALGTSGRGEVVEADPNAAAPEVEPLRAEELRRLGEALPCCEALLTGSIDERRAIIATLTRRADADAVALLRWALGAADPDLAVEAALALEEMTASFEARIAQLRQALARKPSADDAQDAAELATDAIEAGLAEPALVPSLAHEARQFYAAAAAADPARAGELAIGRARLELAVLRPDAALAAIDEAVDRVGVEAKSVLLALRDEAVLATHALPWESPSALASYHPAAPPPLAVHRKLSAARRLSGLHRRGTNGVSVTVGVVQVPAPAGTREVPVDKS